MAQLLDVMDYISNSFLMPFISFLTSILVGLGDRTELDHQARWNETGNILGRARLYSFMIRFVVPVVMLVLFLVSTGIGNLF